MNGRGMPVTGIMPIVIPMFSKVWNNHIAATPIHMKLPSSSLAVLAIFTFIGSWGEFLWPSIVLTKKALYTLPVGVNDLQGMFSANWRYIAAGSIISTVPILVFFIAMQRYFISGENDGAVKG